MKKHIKKLTAAFMALAMILSLSVSALADGVDGGDTLQNTVTSQGGKPTDIQTLVFPTVRAHDLDLYFDSHGLIAQTHAERYDSHGENWNNGNRETSVQVDTGNFFFKKVTPTIYDVTDKALADVTGDGKPKAGDDFVVYKKLAANGSTSIFAKYDANGKFEGWVERKDASDSQTPADSAWTASGAYALIADIKGLDPIMGVGLDKIEKMNDDNPVLYFRQVGEVDVTRAGNGGLDCAALVGTIEYAFNVTYDTVDADRYFAYFPAPTEATPNPAPVVYKNLGTAAAGTATAQAPAEPTSTDGTAVVEDFVAVSTTKLDGTTTVATKTVDKAVIKLTLNSNATYYYRQRISENVSSLSKESEEITVINKTNAVIGVMVKAELSNIPGGNGTKSNAGVWSYVYAKDIERDADGKVTFYDSTDASTRKEITGGKDGVPVIYMAIEAKDKAGQAMTDAGVMTYASGKGSMSAGVALAGNEDLFGTHWDNTGAGSYKLSPNDPAEGRDSDFESVSFTITGAIDADNDAWNDLNSPTLDITWSTEKYVDLTKPTLSAEERFPANSAGAEWAVTSTKNTENATLKYITFTMADDSTKQYKLSDVQYAKDRSGTETFTFTFETKTAKPKSIVFTYYDAAKPFRTVDVPLTFS